MHICFLVSICYFLNDKIQSLSIPCVVCFQILTLLEGAIRRDFLSSNFETTTELLSYNTPGVYTDNGASHSGSVPVLPWMPDTSAAVALRLLDLDSSISYMLHRKLESHKEKGDCTVSYLSPFLFCYFWEFFYLNLQS